jgi:hypothetical protein
MMTAMVANPSQPANSGSFSFVSTGTGYSISASKGGSGIYRWESGDRKYPFSTVSSITEC